MDNLQFPSTDVQGVGSSPSQPTSFQDGQSLQPQASLSSAYSTSPQPPEQAPLPSELLATPPLAPTPQKPKRHLPRYTKKITIILVLLILGIGLWFFIQRSNQVNNTAVQLDATDRFSNLQVPLGELAKLSGVSIDSARVLTINGQLRVNNSLVVAPTTRPTGAVAGQIYYDQSSNVLSYYNGRAFVDLIGSQNSVRAIGGASGDIAVGGGLQVVGGTISNTGVLSVQGQGGNINFTSGGGIAINGTTLTNTGVLSLGGQTGDIGIGKGLEITNGTLNTNSVQNIIAGTPNLIVSRDSNGVVTISSVGGGSGTISSPGGTAGRLAKFTGTQTIADSLLSEGGTTITVNGDLSVTGVLTLSTPLSVVSGGTGATTPTGARTNLGAAASGANNDITSLSGLTTPLNVVQGGTGASSLTNNGVVIGQGTGPLAAVTAAGPGLCLVSTGGAPAFQACPGGGGGGVTSLNGLVGALTVANATGSGTTVTINDASTSQKGIAQFNGTNFTAVGGVVNTIQNIGTTATPTFGQLTLNGDLALNGGNITSSGNLTITPAGVLTAGASGQQTILQGNASSQIAISGGGFTTTLGFSGTPTGNIVYNFDRSTTAGTYTVCTTAGNCTGVGGGVTTSGGTTNRLAKFTSAQGIGNSSLSDNGSTVSTTGTLTVQGGNITVGVASSQTGTLILAQSGSAFTGSVTQGALTASRIYTLPDANGTFCLSSGNCSGGVTSLNGLTGALTVANATGSGSTITINDASTSQKGIAQFNSTNFSASGGTINTIQDIAIGSTPTFAGVNTNTITPSGALTVGATSQSFLMQGSAASTITATNGANTTSLTFQSPTANVTYRFLAAAAGAYDICTTAGNCSGVGGGVTTVGGTTNKLAKFTGSQTIGDSIITDNGSTVTIGGTLSVNTITPSAALTIGASSQDLTLQGQALTLKSTASGITNTLSFATPSGSNKTITVPNASGTVVVSASGPLAIDASGNITCATCATGANVSSLDGLTGALTIANTSGAGSTITINDASTSQKGIAQFNSTNFTASGGVINTIQNIDTAAAPTFGRLNVTSSQASNGMLLVNNTNAGATGNLLDLQLNSVSKLAVSPAGALTLTGTINGQTISSAANLTGTLTVAGAANLNGGAAVTGTLTANTITPTSALTVGATSQNFLLQGSSGSTVTATSGANTTTLAFQTPTANVTYQLLTAAAGTYDICTTAGNCTGVGGGVTTPGGTTNKLAKFTGSQTIGDSIITDNGSTVTIGGTLAVNTVTPSAAMTIGATSQNLTLQGATTNLTSTSGGVTNTLTFATPGGGNKTITIPNATGTVAVSVSGPLSLDANGNITCSTCVTSGGGGGGAAAVDSLDGLTGALTLANSSGSGTTVTINDASTSQKGIAQFNSTNFTASSGIINTIQDINTTAAPAFGRLSLVSSQASNPMFFVNNTNASATGNLLDLQLNSASKLSVSPAGNLTLVGTVNGQTISSAANLTGTLAVAGAANLNGGATVTGTLTANTITPIGSLTVGATSQSFLLQGSSGSTITATSGANATTLAFQAPTANVTYRFLTAAAGTYDVCTTAGNCVGVGGSVTTAGGTTGKIAKFTGSNAIGDSLLSESGSIVTVGGTLAVNTITPTAALTIGDASQNLTLQGKVVSLTSTDSGITNTLTFATPSGSNKTITIPNATGTVAVSASGPLAVDANGNITCTTCTTTSSAVTSLDGLTGALTLANSSGSGSTVTINDASTSQKGIAQFNSTNFSASSGTINTIQDINTTAAPTFGQLTLSSSQATAAMLTVNNTNASGTGNLIDLQLNGSSKFSVAPSGNTIVGGTLTSGIINGQTISSAASFTGSVAVATNLTVNGNTTIGDATADRLTINAQLLGASPLVFQGATDNAFTTTFALTDPTANRMVTFGDETGTVCLQNSANCGFALSSGSGSYIQNQNSTDQTANFRISGTGQANTSLLTPLLDTASAATLNIGTTNATVINLNQNTTIASGKTFTVQGASLFQPSADSTSAVNVKSSLGNNIFTIDTTNSRVGINLGSNNTSALSTEGLEVKGALRLSGNATQIDLFTTPLGANIQTKINIPLYDLPNFGQLVALGVTATSSSSARGIMLLDARSSAHQPTLAILSPDENQVYGLSWDGSNTNAYLKTTTNNLVLQGNSLNLITAKNNSGAANVGIGNGATSGYALDVTGDVNTSTLYRVAGTAGTAVTCSGGQLLQNAVTTGGIVTGGSCVAPDGGVTTIGTLDSQTKSANGAVITGTTLVLQTADASNPGLVSTGTQTIAGAKTLTGQTTISRNGTGTGDYTLGITGAPVNDATSSLIRIGAAVAGGNNAANGGTYIGLNAPSSGAGSAADFLNFQNNGTSQFRINSTGVIIAGGYQGSTINVQYGGTGINTTTAYGLLTGGTTATGAFQNAGTGSSGQILKSNGSAALPTWVSNTAANTCSDCLVQVPGTTVQNTVSPTANSVVGLTVNGTSGTSAAAGIFNQSQTADTLQVNSTNTSGTQTNGIAFTRNGSGGTTTNGVSINQSVGTLTNGLSFSGTIGTDIMRASGTLTLQGAGGASLTTANVSGASGAITIQGGNSSAGTAGNVIVDTGTTSTGTPTLNLGSANAKAIQIGNNTSNPSIVIDSGTGTIGIGTGAQARIINIGTGGAIQTLHVGDSAQANVVTIGSTTGAASTTIQGGTNNLNLITNSASASVIAKSNTNSVTAFQVQNAATASLLTVDTAGSNIQLLGNNSSTLSTWTTTTAMSVGANTTRVRGGAVAANGYLYYLGGVDGTAATLATVEYAKLNADGTVGTWASTTSLPGARRQFQPVVANGYIYVIGGRDNSNTTQATAYYAKLNADGAVGTWNTTTALSNGASARFGQGTVAYSGYIYVMGGFDSSVTIQSGVYSAKINADGTLASSWTSTTALPAGLSSINGSIVANGYVYIPGGFLSGGDTDGMRYAKLNTDGTVGSWTVQSAVIPGGGDENFETYIANGYLYLVGGENGSGVTAFPLNANGSVGTAVSLTAFPVSPVGEGAMAAANGYFYVLGGSSAADGGGTTRNTVYYASTPRIKVGGNLDLVGYGGENLAEGGSGGQLTAGNTSIIGTLQVQDSASFARGVTIGDSLSVNGTATFRNSANSTSAFQVQNAASTAVMQIDTVNSQTQLRAGADTAALGSEMITSNNFSTSWTGTGWTLGASSATHTSGTTGLSPTTPLTVTTGTVYQVTFTVASMTTGNVTPSIGGASGYAVSGNGTQTQLITATGTGNFALVPTTDFNGTVSAVSVKAVTTYAATLQLLDSTGSSTLAIRTGTTTTQNTFMGLSAGQANIPNAGNSNGYANTGVGAYALQGNITGKYNTAVGNLALTANTTGNDNVAIGRNSLAKSTIGNENVALGSAALNNSNSGSYNTAVGQYSLAALNIGSYNTALGYYAGNTDPDGFYSFGNLQNASAIGAYAQVQSNNSLVLGGQGTNAVNVGVGINAPSNTLSISPLRYNTGTASQSGTAVTGSGTTWDSSMVGSLLVFPGTSGSQTITAVTDATHMTVSGSFTVGSSVYRIHYSGLQVTNAGKIGIGTAAPTADLHVDKGTGTSATLKFTAGGTTGATASDGFDVGILSDGTALINQRENLDLGFATSNTVRMTIKNDGKIAFGTYVAGQTAPIQADFGAGNSSFMTFSQGGSLGAFVGIDGTGNAYLSNLANLPLIFGTNSLTRLTIDAAGTSTFASDVFLTSTGTGTTNGLCHSGTNASGAFSNRQIVACSGTPSDMAEWYETKPGVEAGDLVMTTTDTLTYTEDLFNPATGEKTGQRASHTIAVLDKSNKAQSGRLLGIVSTSPYQVFGEAVKDSPDAKNPKAVALNGRVPLKVNDENGPVVAGDPVTASSTPGQAMRATTAGMIVGYALENLSGSSGKIDIFAHIGYYAPPANGAQGGTGQTVQNGGNADFASLNTSGQTTLNTLTVTGDATFQAKVTVKELVVQQDLTINGHLVSGGTAPTIAPALNMQATVNGTDTAGSITIAPATHATAGDLATITFAKPYTNPPHISITAINAAGTTLPIYIDKTAAGFKLRTDTQPSIDTIYTYDYIIVQ